LARRSADDEVSQQQPSAECKASLCDLYRKSSKEGLAQEFNSLQAQREARLSSTVNGTKVGCVCPRLMTMPASPTRRWIAPLCNYFARLVRLSYLTLDITQAILDGRQPADLTADKLLAHSRLPLAWHDQRNVLGFA